MKKIEVVLQDYLNDYNMTFSKETKLVFFQDAIEHVSRYVWYLLSSNPPRLNLQCPVVIVSAMTFISLFIYSFIH